ncbi:DUF4240 domain-containing protein [Bacillus atrophaeus]|uniref:DUF4240 domain-containing protein n=1 Tax=Bacillus atrophaeus TaxID=1452 RepID=UPI0022809DFB|nr:DUF4240 domain-containing protein [Bacillus atrophaeus]MCY8915247.1 DUF4240 domain-containing protein [Bacillus atrophaeus]MCY8924715.1 DUF4240 domain-containing protein [Bacillus atrophaeus]
MNETSFWQLIDQACSQEEPNEWLRDELLKKEINEIVDFEFMLQTFMQKSYLSSLWAAAYILMDGCSDDTFDYFRGRLIAQGKETFEKVLDDHEYLAAYITEETLDEEGYPQNEDLLSVEALTYMKTGDDEWDDEVHDELLDALEQKEPAESDEIELDWEEEDLPERFPKLWERFEDNPLGEF